MLIEIQSLSRKLNLRGAVVHCGAHLAEEGPLYESLDFSPVFWVEAQSRLAQELRENLNLQRNIVIHGAVWSQPSLELSLLISNNGQSSSLLEFGSHKWEHPEIFEIGRESVRTVTVDDFTRGFQGDVALLNLDVQGAELEALRGASETLPRVQMVYTEVNFEEVYLGCPHASELDDYLSEFGLRRVLTARTKHGWGDAVYLRTASLGWPTRFHILNLRLKLIFAPVLDVALRPAVRVWRLFRRS